MPAISQNNSFEFAGVGYHSNDEVEGFNKKDLELIVNNSRDKALKFINEYGGCLYNSYHDVIADHSVSAIYIPLPPIFHYKYAKDAIMSQKHVMIEKPAVLTYEEMNKLVSYAKERNLAIHENYMFMFHSQLHIIKQFIDSGSIGDVRLYRISFGFPFRGKNDFRYNKSLGGGALIDAGGYTIKLASYLLGETTTIDSAISNFVDDFDVDFYGQGVLKNKDNQVAQVSFGIDNDYKCNLEVWGSKGTLYTNRIFTAPTDYKPIISIIKNGVKEDIMLSCDDSFYNSICYFEKCIGDKDLREKNYKALLYQAKLFESFKDKAGLVW